MYSTCLFCHASLGTNDVVEHFPVGRRLAFDAAMGRLWVVCRRCERWNLTPLEERWEAIEECERLFSATRLRMSTDNVGLGRTRDGLELVRIGAPQRPELASWRYGDQFGRRRRRHIVLTGAGIAAAVGLIIVGPATGLIAGSGWGLYNLGSSGFQMYHARRVRARLHVPSYDRPIAIRLKQVSRAAIVATEDAWALRIPIDKRRGSESPVARPGLEYINTAGKSEWNVVLTGDDAVRTAGKLLPHINAAGAKAAEVSSAVTLLEAESDPLNLFKRHAVPVSQRQNPFKRGHVLANLPAETRLALEMVSHEESERRALAGELAMLEASWRQAEEIAAIADDMFVTDQTRAKLASFDEHAPPEG